MSKPILAAQLYTVRDHTQTADDFRATLKKVSEIGYRSVQVSGIGPIPVEEVKAALDDNKLTCCITHISYDRLLNDLPQVIEEHKLWGCNHVGIGSMPPEFRGIGEAGYKNFIPFANEVSGKLADEGMTFGYHNHSFEFERYGNRTGLDILYDDSKNLNAILDTYWIQHGGADSAAWVHKVAGRMPVIHVKDMVMQGKEQIMAEVGEGNLNWPAILAACEETGVQYLAVEQDICQRDPFESLAISYKNLASWGYQ